MKFPIVHAVLFFSFVTGGQAPAAKTVLITGANQGIGWEYARQYAEKGWEVIATHRRSETPESLLELERQYPNLRSEQMDVTQIDQIDALAVKLQGVAIDHLVNNAGGTPGCEGGVLSPDMQFGTLDYDCAEGTFAVMSFGVMKVSERFYPQVRASEDRIISVVTSETGLISAARTGHVPEGVLWLGASKAAINYLFAKLAYEKRQDGVIFLALDPGLVRDTNEEARMRAEGIEVPELQRRPGMPERTNIDISVAGMIRVAEQATQEHSGRIYSYDGRELEP